MWEKERRGRRARVERKMSGNRGKGRRMGESAEGEQQEREGRREKRIKGGRRQWYKKVEEKQ